jgi:hypothetical protein
MESPNEKAKELFDKMLMHSEFEYDAKQCALIAVDLIIYHTEEDSSNIPLYNFYLQVKQEIELL